MVNCTGLKVRDADLRVLASRFEKADAAGSVRLLVEESGARYPLTIDPIARQGYLKTTDTSAGDGFGFRVAVSGESVVVSAYLEDSGATGVNGNQTGTAKATGSRGEAVTGTSVASSLRSVWRL